MRRLFRYKFTPAQHLAMMRQVLATILVMGIAYAGFSPALVQAQEYDPSVIDLVLGGEGATGWAIENIMPCDSGTQTVTLHNAGSADGFVIIWISNIVSGECVNPESETDTTEPGELDDHLLFDLSATGLSTNLSLPTTINNLPQSIDDPNYIRISPLNDGDTITLNYDWELPCETGNEAQGDCLSFTINYLLEEFPPPPSSPPRRPTERAPFVPPKPPPPRPPLPEPVGRVAEVRFCPDDVSVSTDPGLCFASNVDLGTLALDNLQDVVAVTNDAPLIFPVGDTIVTWTTTDIKGNRVTCTQLVTVIEDARYLEIDMLGKISRVRLECPGCTVAETNVVSDPNDMHFFTIERGTHVLCQYGDTNISCPEIIVMSLAEETMSAPYGMAIISPVYEFKGYEDRDLRYPICSRVDFDLPVTMLLSYDLDKLPEGASSPFIAYKDTEHTDWVKLESAATGGIAEVGKANGLTQHLSFFAIMVEKPTYFPYFPISPTVSGVDWRLIVAIVGGSMLLFWLIRAYVHRRRHKRSTEN